jgi:DNA-directed RNA polymerase specialized sigma54-like protein
MKMGLRLNVDLRLPFGNIGAIVLGTSEAELVRFIEEYAKHELTKPPKGQKTWAALLVAMHHKSTGKEKPLDPMADSQVQRVNIDYRTNNIEIRKIDGEYEPVTIGREFARVKENLMKRDWTPEQRKKIGDISSFIESSLEYKRMKYRQILARQKRFLDTGDILDIRPGGLREVAQEIGVSPSTVSRLMIGLRFYLGRRRIDSLHLVPGSKFNQIVVPELVRRTKKGRGRLTHEEVAQLLKQRYPGMLQTSTGNIARRTVAKLLGRKPRRATNRRT